MKTVNRSGSQLLGANGRDDGAIVSPLIVSHLLKFFFLIKTFPERNLYVERLFPQASW